MPAGTVERDDGVRAVADLAADLGEMFVHGMAVGGGQDEARAHAARRADGTEQVRPVVALVAWCRRPAALRNRSIR